MAVATAHFTLRRPAMSDTRAAINWMNEEAPLPLDYLTLVRFFVGFCLTHVAQLPVVCFGNRSLH